MRILSRQRYIYERHYRWSVGTRKWHLEGPSKTGWDLGNRGHEHNPLEAIGLCVHLFVKTSGVVLYTLPEYISGQIGSGSRNALGRGQALPWPPTFAERLDGLKTGEKESMADFATQTRSWKIVLGTISRAQ